MLDLPNILWVIPGVVFVHFYNLKRPQNNIGLTGWPYVFTIVLVAAFTWLPVQWLLSLCQMALCTNEILAQVFTVGLSSILSYVLVISILWFCRESTRINRLFLPPVRDNFYNKCIAWKNKSVFITLKNGKAYIGILWEYPENPQSKHASQTISIIPLVSGYRDTNQEVQVATETLTKRFNGTPTTQSIKINPILWIWKPSYPDRKLPLLGNSTIRHFSIFISSR